MQPQSRVERFAALFLMDTTHPSQSASCCQTDRGYKVGMSGGSSRIRCTLTLYLPHGCAHGRRAAQRSEARRVAPAPSPACSMLPAVPAVAAIYGSGPHPTRAAHSQAPSAAWRCTHSSSGWPPPDEGSVRSPLEAGELAPAHWPLAAQSGAPSDQPVGRRSAVARGIGWRWRGCA